MHSACSSSDRHPRPRLATVLAACLTVLALALAPGAHAQPGPVVFAAASLTNAFEEIGRQWRQAGNPPARFSFAASSALARQIEAGAPAAIFASADAQWMDELARRGLIVPETRTDLLGNRLVLIAPVDTPLPPGLGPNATVRRGIDLAGLLGDRPLAVGDPDHVPAGRYARQALEALDLWPQAAPRLARADNVRVALALVERGEAPYGIVYATDAAATPRVKVAATFPADSHTPIVYPVAVVRGHDGPAARGFLAFLGSPQAAAVFRRHGFPDGH